MDATSQELISQRVGLHQAIVWKKCPKAQVVLINLLLFIQHCSFSDCHNNSDYKSVFSAIRPDAIVVLLALSAAFAMLYY